MPKNSIESGFRPPGGRGSVGPFGRLWFAQPASTILNVDHMMDAIDRGLDETLTEHWIATHLRPFERRLKGAPT